MNPTEAEPEEHRELARKIGRLVQERGWNLEDFARIAHLNRHTVRTIVQASGRRIRNATVQACARALGLTVSDLRMLPLERLLLRMRGEADPAGEDSLRRLIDASTLPELRGWVERNPDRARRLAHDEIDELLALQGPNGPLALHGVETFVDRLERRRRLLEQVRIVASTEYLGLLEQLVGLLHEKVRPRDRL